MQNSINMHLMHGLRKHNFFCLSKGATDDALMEEERMKSVLNLRVWVAALAVGLAMPAMAMAGEWVTPAIDGYGGVHPLPHAMVQPNPKHRYKAIFDVTSHAKDPSEVNPGLKHVARAVNAFASAGVPLSHLHFVAIVHGPATSAILSDAAYKKLFNVDNPNIDLLSKLKKAGVKVFVCGQAMYDLKYPLADVSKDVHVALSALPTVVIYGDMGYAYMKQ
jgi:intracellular sulfur oxidation DsrE/DsrF family protein